MINENVTLSDLKAPLFTSRSSELYAWGEDKVLKLFFPSANTEFEDYEEINLIEAYQKGVSSVEFYERVKIEGRNGLVIKKLAGQTLLALLGTDPSYLEKVPPIMANLQLKLHATQTRKMRPYKAIVLAALETESLAFLNKAEKSAAEKYVLQLPDGNCILHLDYHPDNIMSDGTTTSIIDWATAAHGVPAADVATTVHLLTAGEVPPGTSPEAAAFLNQLRAEIFKNYMQQYRATSPISDDELDVWKLPVLIVRLGVWNIESESAMLREKIYEELIKITN